MEFNYLIERARMLNSFGRTSEMCNGVNCDDCPLNGDNKGCDYFEGEHPLEATEIVRKWAEEHPRKTRKDILLEKFPAENKELKEDFEESKRVNLNMGRLAGQNEAWELARKCMLMTDREREAIFGSGHNALYGVLTYFDYKHAASKVEEWEKAKEEIKVGDVFEFTTGNKAVVMKVYEDGEVTLFFLDGGCGIYKPDESCHKTGRHIDIDGFLKQIRGEEECINLR